VTPLTRDIMVSAERKMGNWWARTGASRVRSGTDLPPIGVATHLALGDGTAHLVRDDVVRGFFHTKSSIVSARAFARARPHLACANDMRTEAHVRAMRALVTKNHLVVE
jgi:hypothetical protein